MGVTCRGAECRQLGIDAQGDEGRDRDVASTSGSARRGEFPPDDVLVKHAFAIIKQTQSWIARQLRDDAANALRPYVTGGKELLALDLTSESLARDLLLRAYGGTSRIRILGEESLWETSIDLSSESRLVVILDMVDGTDLLARRLSNWCSAMVFLWRREILAAFVGLPGEGIYYATHSDARAFIKPPGRSDAQAVSGPTLDAQLATASISFYGQKAKNFLSLADRRSFREALRKTSKRKPGPRLYNLGGNPMMMRLIDGKRRIDAVIDVEGQLPHDAVPGAFIARRAGATLLDLHGAEIDEAALATALLRPADPASELRYVLAGSRALARELVGALARR